MKKSIAAILLALLVLSAFGCSSSSKLDGTYKLAYAEASGFKITIEQLREFGIGSDFILEIKGNKCTVSFDGDTSTETVKINGNTMEVNVEGSPLIFTLSDDGKSLSTNYSDVLMVFEKQ